jgi:hypothetical protein
MLLLLLLLRTGNPLLQGPLLPARNQESHVSARRTPKAQHSQRPPCRICTTPNQACSRSAHHPSSHETPATSTRSSRSRLICSHGIGSQFETSWSATPAHMTRQRCLRPTTHLTLSRMPAGFASVLRSATLLDSALPSLSFTRHVL